MRQRRLTSIVRLQVDINVSEKILEILVSNLPIDKQDVYRIRGSIGLARLMELHAVDRPDLKDKPFSPSIPQCFNADADDDVF